MAVIAANPAPALTPTMPGSAKGLRNRPCITAPETARAAPTRMPIARRGRRMSNKTTRSSVASSRPWIKSPRVCQSEMPEAPEVSEKIETRSKEHARTRVSCLARMRRSGTGATLLCFEASESSAVTVLILWLRRARCSALLLQRLCGAQSQEDAIHSCEPTLHFGPLVLGARLELTAFFPRSYRGRHPGP